MVHREFNHSHFHNIAESHSTDSSNVSDYLEKLHYTLNCFWQGSFLHFLKLVIFLYPPWNQSFRVLVILKTSLRFDNEKPLVFLQCVITVLFPQVWQRTRVRWKYKPLASVEKQSSSPQHSCSHNSVTQCYFSPCWSGVPVTLNTTLSVSLTARVPQFWSENLMFIFLSNKKLQLWSLRQIDGSPREIS